MAGKRSGVFGRLQDQALRTIADNAATLRRLPAKVHAAQRIYDEEEERAMQRGRGVASDNRFDAERHARTSYRMTKLLGPHLAALGGYGVEAGGLARNIAGNIREQFDPNAGERSFGDALASMHMDLRNNAEGRRAAVEGRPIDPSRLQTAPNGVAEYEFLYDAPRPRRRTTAHR